MRYKSKRTRPFTHEIDPYFDHSVSGQNDLKNAERSAGENTTPSTKQKQNTPIIPKERHHIGKLYHAAGKHEDQYGKYSNVSSDMKDKISDLQTEYGGHFIDKDSPNQDPRSRNHPLSPKPVGKLYHAAGKQENEHGKYDDVPDSYYKHLETKMKKTHGGTYVQNAYNESFTVGPHHNRTKFDDEKTELPVGRLYHDRGKATDEHGKKFDHVHMDKWLFDVPKDNHEETQINEHGRKLQDKRPNSHFVNTMQADWFDHLPEKEKQEYKQRHPGTHLK